MMPQDSLASFGSYRCPFIFFPGDDTQVMMMQAGGNAGAFAAPGASMVSPQMGTAGARLVIIGVVTDVNGITARCLENTLDERYGNNSFSRRKITV